MYDICVFAGRFRPFHNGHLAVVNEALKNAQYLFMLVGSCDEPINFRNPFTFEEVREMIRASLSPRDADRVFIFPLVDRDNDIKWVSDVQAAVKRQADRLSFGRDPKIALIGYAKDGSSYYLKLFPQWGSIAVEQVSMLDATTLRNSLYTTDRDPTQAVENMYAGGDKGVFPRGTYYLLREWVGTERYHTLRDEYAFMKDYLDQFPQQPYPRFFTAADACVIQSGHVLLVRRGQMPGKGLWALPGGHVGKDESFRQAAIRELIEETQIDIDFVLLDRSVRGELLLDNPWRSTRFRTISVAYGIELIGTKLPLVEGSDDAHTARWWPIDEVTRQMCFEDHFNVVQHFANKFGQ